MSRILLWTVTLGGLVLGGCGACSKQRGEAAPTPSSAPPPVQRTPNAFEVAEVVYEGKLSPGWDDWGWGTHDLKPGQPANIQFSGFGGLILHHEVLPSKFGGFSFRFKAPEAWGDFLQVSLQYQQVDETKLPPVKVQPKDIAPLPDGWREVYLPWAQLNPNGSPFDRIQIHAYKSVPDQMVSLDKIVLTRGWASANAAPDGPAKPVKVMVDCSGQARPINPMIYGMAGEYEANHAGAFRLGGNPTSRWNWELGVWNVGADWFFENTKASVKIHDLIVNAANYGTKVAVTVPMIGWVSKDDSSAGFPVSKHGPQRNRDQYRAEAGDGFEGDGKEVRPGPPTQTSVAAPPELIGKWIADLRRMTRDKGKGVEVYFLDNEPNLWSSTHRDVHPDPMTYDELLDRSIRYGTAIRKADPEGKIAGPAEWGWTAYFYSAKDTAKGLIPHVDQLAHGGTPLIPWYLRKLAAHEKKTGTKILDMLDVHYYPQGNGIWGNNGATDRETSARRLRATRSLWDPKYIDESWINDKVRLIPRLQEWVQENYPGLGTSLGEWNFGAEEHISGGMAVAESLGRFGQGGLTAAFYWVHPPKNSPAFYAFKAYRNYDGKGAKFQDLSIPTQVPAEDVSAFASRSQDGTKITVVLLNQDFDNQIDVTLDVARCGLVSSKRSFFYTEGSNGLLERPAPKGGTPTSPDRLANFSFAVVELTVKKGADIK